MVRSYQPPGPPRGTDVAGRLHSAALHLLRRVALEDRALGVSPPRLSALSVLVFRGPLTIGALAAAEGVTPPTMTRLLAGMARDGLIERQAVAGDRRAVRVAATDAGRALLLEGRDRRVAALDRLLMTCSDADLATLKSATDILEALLREGH